MGLLDDIISDRPSFHSSETEIERPFAPAESLLEVEAARELARGNLVCYAIGEDVLRFLADRVDENSRTLETGIGCSTLVFAIRGGRHTAITPSRSEIERVRAYCEQYGIALNKVQLISEPSERYLPRCDVGTLDLVLIDGKHAFPWPIIDWFYTCDRLRQGGLMVLDDAQMRSVRILAEFMSADPGWECTRRFSEKTLVFTKLREDVLDVAWHMQPWTMLGAQQPSPGGNALFGRISRRVGAVLQRTRLWRAG